MVIHFIRTYVDGKDILHITHEANLRIEVDRKNTFAKNDKGCTVCSIRRKGVGLEMHGGASRTHGA